MSAFSTQEKTIEYERQLEAKLREILCSTSIKQCDLSTLLDGDGLAKFKASFTHPECGGRGLFQNYEYMEMKGDVVANHAIVEALGQRFPHFVGDAEAVRIVTRLKINLVSKDVYSGFAHRLGFWPFIIAPDEVRSRQMKPLLEDCFEAFIGTVSHLLDTRCAERNAMGRPVMGKGFQISFEIVQSLLDKLPICGGLPDDKGVQHGLLNYDELVDSITQVKEVFDVRFTAERLGRPVYKCSRIPINPTSSTDTICEAILTIGHKGRSSQRSLCFIGRAALQANAKQAAASHAMEWCKRNGYSRPLAGAYARFCHRR